MDQWFDYAICDEAHQLANLSAGTNNGEERERTSFEHRNDSAWKTLNPRLPPHYFPLEAEVRFRVSPATPGDPGRASSEAAWPDERPPFQAPYALFPNWIGRNGVLYPDGRVQARPGLR